MSGSIWASARLPASFRGVPFVVLENQLRRGRQTAVHVYPFRDDPWPEDVGRSPRITSFRGFVIGDDADFQMQALVDAVEAAGPGTLVHPVLGTLNVQVLSFTTADDPARGRVWTFDMSVMQVVGRIYPVSAANTQSNTQSVAKAATSSIAAGFASVQGAISNVTSVVRTVQGYAAQASALVGNATMMAHLPATLISGNFGRFASGSVALRIPGLTTISAANTASAAVGQVRAIGSTLSRLAAAL